MSSTPSKSSVKKRPSRSVTTARAPPASRIAAPTRGGWLAFNCTVAVVGPVIRSTSSSTSPPVALCPRMRARMTRVSLNTTRSEGRNSEGRSVKRRSAYLTSLSLINLITSAGFIVLPLPWKGLSLGLNAFAVPPWESF